MKHAGALHRAPTIAACEADNAGLDAFDIEAGLMKAFLARAVLDEAVRQAEVQQRDSKSL